MSKAGEVPAVSRTVLMPDPYNGTAGGKTDKRVSISSSILSDTTDTGDPMELRTLQKSKLQRGRKRLSTFLHTHVVLILVCLLSVLDAVCVIGQIICDILIMKDSIGDWEDLDKNLTSMLWTELPSILNTTEHDSADSLNLKTIADLLWEHQQISSSSGASAASAAAIFSQLLASGVVDNSEGLNTTGSLGQASSQSWTEHLVRGVMRAHHRRKRAALPDGKEATVYHDLTHIFHLGSLIILSALLLECLLKVFAMGKKLLHHKLEMFDIFVVAVSWSLDVAFWEGIWAHPETEAATILIVMLPWRVIRIVNSFVLTIQEKDHVELKIFKQRLRMSIKKGKDLFIKASSYKAEVRELQALCRKYGALDLELIACIPLDRRTKRIRKSLKPGLSHRDSALSLTPSSLSAFPSLSTMPDSSSSDDDDDVTFPNDVKTSNGVKPSKAQQGSSLRSGVSSSTLDEVFVDDRGSKRVPGGVRGSGKGVDNPGFNPEKTSEQNGGVSRQDSLTRL